MDGTSRGAELYLDLLKGVLTRALLLDEEVRDVTPTGWKALLARQITKRGYRIVTAGRSTPTARAEGRDWPADAETMIGLRRLDNVQHCCETAITDGVPGDFIETGVWRGGATILMRAVLAAHAVTDRNVWVADSFEGLPKPDPRFPADAGDELWTHKQLAVGVEDVKARFARYGLLDDQVKFLVGWFADTLPTAPIQQLAVARLDGDLYASTWDALNALYPRVSAGGFVIVDDYLSFEAQAGQAVRDYREAHNVTAPIEQIDWTGVFWRKPG